MNIYHILRETFWENVFVEHLWLTASIIADYSGNEKSINLIRKICINRLILQSGLSKYFAFKSVVANFD